MLYPPFSARLLGVTASYLLFGVLSAGFATEAPKPSPYKLSVLADHPEAIYKKGDPVVFTIRLTDNDQPVNGAVVNWKISKDGVPPVKEGTVELKDGQATVTATLDEPGFLLCRAEFQRKDEATKPISALGAAGIDPLDIQPSLPVPDDFDHFWAEQKRALSEVPVNARLTPQEVPNPGLELFDLQADCIGTPVSGYFARPKGAKPKSLPAILNVHGAGVRSSSRDIPLRWAKENMLALDINAHGVPNGKPAEFYNTLQTGELKNYTWRGRESRETFYFKGMFLRVLRAIDFLASQPEWDGQTIIVYGSSQGGAQAIAAAGLDSRVSLFVAGIPAMCDMSGAVANRIAGWPKPVSLGSDGKINPTFLQTSRYYDGMNFVTRTKASAFFAVGFIDITCPPTSVYAVYNNLSSKKQIFNDIREGHKNTNEAQKRMRAAVLEHVARRNASRPTRLEHIPAPLFDGSRIGILPEHGKFAWSLFPIDLTEL
jgi:cephalosporin-C deacetylase